MKALHRPDLFAWSRFDEARNMDFHSVLWVRPGGNVAIDPLPLSPHDAAHVDSLGGVAWIVVTNGDHVRDAVALRERTAARLCGPRQDVPAGVVWDRALQEGDEVVPGLYVLELEGSKTPGELALLLEETTLVTGDLVRAPVGGRLATLPAGKLADVEVARESVRSLAALERVEAVLVGDGWPIFRDGARALADSSRRSDRG